MIAETGSSIAVVGVYRKGAYREGACRKKGSISSRVDLSGRVGIGASSGKGAFRLSREPLLLDGALSIVYSREVGE